MAKKQKQVLWQMVSDGASKVIFESIPVEDDDGWGEWFDTKEKARKHYIKTCSSMLNSYMHNVAKGIKLLQVAKDYKI